MNEAEEEPGLKNDSNKRNASNFHGASRKGRSTASNNKHHFALDLFLLGVKRRNQDEEGPLSNMETSNSNETTYCALKRERRVTVACGSV